MRRRWDRRDLRGRHCLGRCVCVGGVAGVGTATEGERLGLKHASESTGEKRKRADAKYVFQGRLLQLGSRGMSVLGDGSKGTLTATVS